MTISTACLACDNNARFDSLPPRERIAADPYWRVAHAFGTGLPGWLVLQPHRHVTTIAELTDAEAAVLGEATHRPPTTVSSVMLLAVDTPIFGSEHVGGA